MTRTIELLDSAKKVAGIETDYAFGKKYGFSNQTISGWRQGKKTFGDDAAEVIAGILGKEPGEVMAICHAERAKNEHARSRWLRVAALLAASMLPPGASAAAGSFFDNNSDDIRIIRRRIRRLLGLDFPAMA